MPQLEIGTPVDVYASDGVGRPNVWQGTAEIAGYARNRCDVVRELNFGTTWHRHTSQVRPVGELLPAGWHPKKDTL